MTNDKEKVFKETGSFVTLVERERLLLSQPGFTELAVNDIGTLIGMMEEVHVEEGENIVVEGELTDSIFILVSGTAEVTREVVVNGKSWSSLYATLYAGNAIGLVGSNLLTRGSKRSATVMATVPCLLLKIELERLKKLLKQKPEILNLLQPKNNNSLKLQLLRQAASFTRLNPQQLAGLVSDIKEISFESGQTIFKEGDPVDGFYLISHGQVEISCETDQKINILGVFEPFYIFGVQEFSQYAKRTTTARTLSQCDLLVMDRDLLIELSSAREKELDPALSLVQEYCKPVRHSDVVFQHRKSADGKQLTTLKNLATNEYIQLPEEGWFLWTKMDGKRNLADLTHLLHQQYGIKTPEEVKNTVKKLLSMNFITLDIDEPDSSQSNMTWRNRFINFSFLFKNPDKKLKFFYQYFGFVFFYKPIVILQILWCFSGLFFFFKVQQPAFDSLKITHSVMYFFSVIVFSNFLSEMITPFFKGLSMEHFSCKVSRWGLLLNKLIPIGFIDTSTTWLSNTRKRAMISYSGIHAKFLLAALFSTYCYFSFSLFLWLSATILYIKVLRTLNPFINKEGYELLGIIFHSSQIRENSIEWFLKNRKMNHQSKSELGFWIYTLIYYFLSAIFTLKFFVEVVQYQGLTTNWTNLVICCLVFAFGVQIYMAVKQQKQLQNASFTG